MAAPETCPNCGADVPRNAKACPECGSCDETGWSEGATASGLDLPEEAFDYQDFVEREFAGEKIVPRGIPWFWWVIALGVLAAFILVCFR